MKTSQFVGGKTLNKLVGGTVVAKRFVAFLLVSFMVLSALGLSQPAGGDAAPTWSAPVTVTTGIYGNPYLVIGQNYEYLMAWQYPAGSVQLFRSADQGASWQLTKDVFGGGVWGAWPAMCGYRNGSNDELIVVAGGGTGSYVARVAVSSNNGNTFTAMTPLPAFANGGWWTSMAVGTRASWFGAAPDHDIFVWGTHYVSGNFYIAFTKSTDGGRSWSVPVDICGTTKESYCPATISDGSRLYLTYSVYGSLNKTSFDRYIIYSNDWGATWSNAAVLLKANTYEFYRGFNMQLLDSTHAIVTMVHWTTSADLGTVLSSEAEYGLLNLTSLAFNRTGAFSNPSYIIGVGVTGWLEESGRFSIAFIKHTGSSDDPLIVTTWDSGLPDLVYPPIPPLPPAAFHLNLAKGWNLVSVPLAGSGYKASTLGLGAGASIVSWNSTTQSYRSFIVGHSPPSYDFELALGSGYWVWAPQAQSIILQGYLPTTPVKKSVTVPSTGGWFLGGICGEWDFMASELALHKYTGTMSMIARFNPGMGFQTYLPSIPPSDFLLRPGEGFWSWCESSGVLTPIMLPPVASFTYAVQSNTVTVDGSSSYDPDGYLISYEWSFGDGATAVGTTASHTYSAAGVYNVTLKVTDNNGIADSTSADVLIFTPVPTASFTWTSNGLWLVVNGSESRSDSGIASFMWDWGDGSGPEVTTQPLAAHLYAASAVPMSAETGSARADSAARAPSVPYPIVGLVTDINGVPVGGAQLTITNLRTGLYNDSLVSDSTPGSVGYYVFDLTTLGVAQPGDPILLVAHFEGQTGSNMTQIPTLFPGYIWGNVSIGVLHFRVALTVTDGTGQTNTTINKVSVRNCPTTPYPLIGIAFNGTGVPTGGARITITNLRTGLYDNSTVSDSTPGSVGYYIFDANSLGLALPGDRIQIAAAYGASTGVNITVIPSVFRGYVWGNVTMYPPSDRAVTYEISHFFESYLKNSNPTVQGNRTATPGLNIWWTGRGMYYGELVLRNTYPFVTAYPLESGLTVPDVDPGFGITTMARMNITAKNLEGVGTNIGKDPIFVPVLNHAVGGGVVTLQWRSDVMAPWEITEMKAVTSNYFARTYYGAPRIAVTDDGWWNELYGHITLDRLAAQAYLGLPGSGDLRTEFTTANAGNAIGNAWLNDWMTETGMGGIYDISPAYEYANDIRQLVLTLDPMSTPDKLNVRIWSMSWGNDMLLMRYFDVSGLNPYIQSFFEDMYLNATIGPTSGNFETSYYMQYAILAWADPTTGDGSWMLEPTHADIVGSQYPPPAWQSRFDPYDPEHTNWMRTSRLPGTVHYGQQVSYWSAPSFWNLKPGEKLTVKLPATSAVGFEPYVGASDILSMTKQTELNSHAYTGQVVPGKGSPDMTPYYNPATKTITILGPTGFQRNPNPSNPLINYTGVPQFLLDVSRAPAQYIVTGVTRDVNGLPIGGSTITITNLRTGEYDNTLLSDTAPGNLGHYVFDLNALGAPLPGDVIRIEGARPTVNGVNETTVPRTSEGLIWLNVSMVQPVAPYPLIGIAFDANGFPQGDVWVSVTNLRTDQTYSQLSDPTPEGLGFYLFDLSVLGGVSPGDQIRIRATDGTWTGQNITTIPIVFMGYIWGNVTMDQLAIQTYAAGMNVEELLPDVQDFHQTIFLTRDL